MEWLEVVENAGPKPVRDARMIGSDELPIVAGPIVVAWGTVDGIPWQVDAGVTGPSPRGDWWNHGPVGPELALSVGFEGTFGGGGGPTHLNEGTHLTADIGFFGPIPRVVSWLGVVSDEVDSLKVRLDDGNRRTIEIRDVPLDRFPRAFWFSPPHGAPGQVVALAADGRELQRERLVDLDVHPMTNAAMGINGFGFRTDRPPPGWPDDPTEYAPGEGPRHAEDFHLHEVDLPLHVAPPDRWDGYSGRSGSGSSGARIENVRFGYFDEPGGRERGFEVVNETGAPSRFIRPPRNEDVGTWWQEETADGNGVNFAARFLSREGMRALQDERGWYQPGPVRLEAIVEFDVAGSRVTAARRQYRRHPQLREIRFEVPPTRITMLGWNLSFEELEGHARGLRRLELGTPLFHAMRAAQIRSDARFDELHGHEPGDRGAS